MSENIIKLENVTKCFPGGVVANKDITMEVKKGHIHAIAGENGAGKSTLMNTLYGLHQPTSGKMFVKGKEVKFNNSKEAIEAGLGMVHQHFMLIPKFTVTQNIILGLETGTQFKINYAEAVERVRTLSEKYNLKIDPEAKVSDISVSMQQRVEILKILYRNADILIFDEPTAVLAPQEINEFCTIMENLRKEGKTIIFISHKLAEVMRVADRVTVIRLGQVVDTVDAKEIDETKLAVMMVGHEISLGGGERHFKDDYDHILDISNIQYKVDGVNKLNDLSISLRKGEILGIAGVDGNGQEELVEIITGKKQNYEGSVVFDGENLKGKSIKYIKENGMAVIYEDRHKDGLILQYSIKDNLAFGYHDRPKFLSKKYFMNNKAMIENAEKMKKDFDIRCASINQAAGTLSGGNQQKIILAREITANPKMVMAVQPTRGLDLGAIEFVHEALVAERNKNKGILLFSLELDEILQLSDRVAVIFKGEIVAVLDNKNLTKEILGQYMLGLKRDIK